MEAEELQDTAPTGRAQGARQRPDAAAAAAAQSHSRTTQHTILLPPCITYSLKLSFYIRSFSTWIVFRGKFAANLVIFHNLIVLGYFFLFIVIR